MDPELVLVKQEGECKDKALHSRYRSVVGSINHAAVTVRCDCAYAVRALAAHLQHPTAVHLAAAERVLGYLYFTRDLGLTYTGVGRVDAPLCQTFFGTSSRGLLSAGTRRRKP
jgi:hypothetical protein